MKKMITVEWQPHSDRRFPCTISDKSTLKPNISILYSGISVKRGFFRSF